MKVAKELGAKRLNVKRDSKLIIKQLKGEYGAKVASLADYKKEALALADALK